MQLCFWVLIDCRYTDVKFVAYFVLFILLSCYYYYYYCISFVFFLSLVCMCYDCVFREMNKNKSDIHSPELELEPFIDFSMIDT